MICTWHSLRIYNTPEAVITENIHPTGALTMGAVLMLKTAPIFLIVAVLRPIIAWRVIRIFLKFPIKIFNILIADQIADVRDFNIRVN